ncbi:hypothetical protein [Sporolactobacillus pectinivorans]|nr:hypothetical protein [Sporolactobacillus pectinivorans]
MGKQLKFGDFLIGTGHHIALGESGKYRLMAHKTSVPSKYRIYCRTR